MRDGNELVGWGMATGIWEALHMPIAVRIVLSANGHAEVLGYDVKDRKLVVNEDEADRVRLIFRQYLASPPEGRARWTLELLADELVRLTEHDSISRETVRRRLVENDLKPWRKDMWCIPQVDGEYVARMEDVLDLYAEAPDPKRPVVCFDESPTQLIRGPAADPGHAGSAGALRLRV